MVRVTCKAQG